MDSEELSQLAFKSTGRATLRSPTLHDSVVALTAKTIGQTMKSVNRAEEHHRTPGISEMTWNDVKCHVRSMSLHVTSCHSMSLSKSTSDVMTSGNTYCALNFQIQSQPALTPSAPKYWTVTKQGQNSWTSTLIHFIPCFKMLKGSISMRMNMFQVWGPKE